MLTRPMNNLRPLLAVGLSIMLMQHPAAAEDSFKVIDAPGGGQVVYGPVQASSAQSAMGVMLRNVHRHFGAVPTVGKVFQSRDGQTYGAFFTLTPEASHEPIAGLVIIAASAGVGIGPAAAVLYDNAARFAKTEPVLMRDLIEGWRQASAQRAATNAPAATTSSNVPSLTPTRFPDGSGAVSLPAGWQITFASHGSAKIVGPKGETVLLSNTVGPIYDPNDPRVQSRLRYAAPNSRPLMCRAADALQTYQCVLRLNNPQASLEVTQSRPLPPQGRAVQSVLIDANLDLHDGRGPLSCELGLSITAINALASRTLGINGTCAPQSSATLERPTLKAIYDSYSINGQVVAREFARDEDRSRAAGAAARNQAAAAHAAEDAQSASFQAHMDNIDRFSKSFQNYQLDQTELQDNNANTRGAVPNELADALVKSNPDRFQTVTTQNFLKGVDF
jgi:hypothetical protein